jgi:hypothetical protein
MERLFQFLAVGLAGVAAYFLVSGKPDAAFVTAVLGAVAFFLGIRFPMKERNRVLKTEREDGSTADDDQDADTRT